MPPTPGMPRLLGMLLVLAALARMVLVVAHEPVLGYADQGDMRRVTACAGLHADAPVAPTPYAPIPRYAIGPVDEPACAYGSEVAIVSIALLAHRILSGESTLALQWIGATKAALATLLLAAGCALLWRFPRAFLLHGVTTFAILGDPLTSLWMNTFYAEIPIFFGAYAMIVALAAIAAGARAGILAMTLFAAGTFLLGLSKMQFFLLPLVLAVFALPVLLPAGRRVAAVAVAIALVPCVALLAPAGSEMVAANRVDAYLGALASSSSDPRATLRRLGLPARCEPLVGATWFRRRGEDIASLCPEARDVGMAAFVPLAIHEPATVATALARALAPGQNAFAGSLGFVAGTRFGRFGEAPAWARSLWEPLFMQLRARHYVVLVAFAAVLGALCALSYGVLALRRLHTAAFAMAFYVALLVLCLAYALATSVLGDGLADIAKHVALGSAALAAALLGALGWWLATWRSDAARATRITTQAIAIVAALGAVPIVAAYRELPLAMGVIDEPGDTRLSTDAVQVRGWALDPYGVRSVEARVGAKRFAAQDDLAYPAAESLYPNLPRAARSGFRAEIPAGALTPEAPVLRVVVTNGRGVETEVDRRRLR